MNTIFGVPADTLLTVLLALLGVIGLTMLFTALRHPLPFRMGLRNLPRRKSQTALVVGGLALSTLIITSALGIGDTVDYSVKSGVYDRLGKIDIQVSANAIAAPAGFGFGSGPAETKAESEWFAASAAGIVASLVDDGAVDGAAPFVAQSLPALNERSGLSEAAVEVRGIGEVTGSGLRPPFGLSDLAENSVIVNASLATALDIQVGDSLLLIKGRPTAMRASVIVPNGELAGEAPTILMPLARSQALFGQPDQITGIFVSAVGGVEDAAVPSAAAAAQIRSALPGLAVNEVKADQIEAAATGAEFITTLFVTFGTFSIVAGVLLIFLIFSVLAAERRSELGMGRAVGLQRADLVRQFVTEGLAYNFLAAALGAALGVGAALLLAGFITGLLGTTDLSITPRVSLRSVLIGYSLGLVITFITVSISAIRTSRVNIIAAIRDLNLPTPPRIAQWTLFLHPFIVWRAALQKAGQGNAGEAIRLFMVAGPKAVLSFWAGLLGRGPVLVALGYAFAWVGVNVAAQSVVYGLGVSLFIIGVGQIMNWLRLPARWAYSFTGLALILYWALPTRQVGKLAEMESSQGDFFLGGIFLVAGAIVLFLYNADALLGLFAGLLSRLGNLLPVARVAIAYPVSAKSRTATTLAMFSLIIFTLVSTATITETFGNFLDVESGSGGYNIAVQTNPFNPLPADKFKAGVDDLVTEGKIAAPTALASATFAPISAQAPGMGGTADYALNGVDADFLATHRLKLSGIANTYDSPEAVWAALTSDASVVVIDGFSVDRGGDPTFQRDEDSFFVSSIQASDTTFAPVQISLTGKDGVAREFTVIGVLSSAPNFFGAMMNVDAASSLGYTGANRFFLRLPDDADMRASANAIESVFSQSGLQTTLLQEELEASRRGISSIFYLIQGFIGLGLLIGIAALGVITIRAVVERRQQIGVLRAIGFQQRMVQNIFLLESLFVAGLGIIIGYGLALTFAYNLYLQVAADQGLPFLPPWATLISIGLAIFVASLLTALFPARASARVVIAEALRYEG